MIGPGQEAGLHLDDHRIEIQRQGMNLVIKRKIGGCLFKQCKPLIRFTGRRRCPHKPERVGTYEHPLDILRSDRRRQFAAYPVIRKRNVRDVTRAARTKMARDTVPGHSLRLGMRAFASTHADLPL